MDFYYYFQARTDYFWNWEENGHVIAIPNGNTIAYRQQVIQTLKDISEQGLPQFGTFLMVMLATNKSADIAIHQVGQIFHDLMQKQNGPAHGLKTELDKALAFLRLLADLPESYKTGEKRSLLLQTLFKDSHNMINSAKGKRFIEQMEGQEADNAKLLNTSPLTRNRVFMDLRLIELLYSRFPDHNAIFNAMASVDEVAKKIELPEILEENIRVEGDFIDELIANPKTFHVGALVKRIWAGLNIPYHHTMPSDQPLGGVSDITNKGQFDKLLVSEFANEDIIFLSRLANNEALYLRREVPPEPDSSQRIILIDTTIKNWGSPKNIAYALLVAIARHPKTDVKCEAYALGEEAQQIQFSNVHELIDALQLLDSTLHPAKGLEAFFKEHPNPREMELFFISTPETVNLPAMQKALSDYSQFFRYFIHTDNEGNIEFFKNQKGGKKLTQSLTLPLDELWGRKPETKVLQEEQRAITFMHCPLLYPIPPVLRKKMAWHDDIFVVTPERRLFKLAYTGTEWQKRKGTHLILEDLADGEYEICQDVDGNYYFLVFTAQNRMIEITELNTKFTKRYNFTDWRSSQYKNFIPVVNGFYYLTKDVPWFFEAKETRFRRVDEASKFTNEQEFKKWVNQHEERVQLQNKIRVWNGNSILKNVKTVGINDNGNLVFNIHELLLTRDSHIKLEVATAEQQVLVAEATLEFGASNKFVFPDGSTILVDRSGMVQLASSHVPSSLIYFPLVLDASLGICTPSVFAGNEYYYDDQRAEMQRKMSTGEFWRDYILTFIKEIIK